MTSSRVSYVVLSGTFLHHFRHFRPSRLAALPFFTARIERRPKGIPGAVDSGGFSLHSMAARRVGRTFLFSWRGIPFRTWRQLVLNHRNVGNELSARLGMPRCQWIHGMATSSTHFHDRNRIRMAWIGPLIFGGRKAWTRRALDPFGLRSSQQNPIHWCSKIIASQRNDISTTGCISCHRFLIRYGIIPICGRALWCAFFWGQANRHHSGMGGATSTLTSTCQMGNPIGPHSKKLSFKWFEFLLTVIIIYMYIFIPYLYICVCP